MIIIGIAKTNVNKVDKTIKIPAKLTAEVTGASEELVLKARAGKRITGKLAKKVLLADEYLGKGMGRLVEEAKKAVNF